MVKKKGTREPSPTAPQNYEEAGEWGRDRYLTMGELHKLEAERQAELKRINASYDEPSRLLKASLKKLVKGLTAFATSRQREVFDSGKQSWKTPDGMGFQWRTGPPFVDIDEEVTSEEEVITYLLHNEDGWGVRVMYELDREVLIRNSDKAEKVPGVKIKQELHFDLLPRKFTPPDEPPA